MIASTSRQRLAAIAFVAACLPVPLVHAQTQPPPPAPAAPGGPPMMDHRPDGTRGGHLGRELMRLKASLKLDANQAQLWDRAEATMRPPADLREQMKTRRDRMAAMLDDPNFDPRQLAADMDDAQAERAATMKGARDAWIGVYQSLNPVQRGQAREFLRSHMSHRSGMREHAGWRHDRRGPSGRETDAPKR